MLWQWEQGCQAEEISTKKGAREVSSSGFAKGELAMLDDDGGKLAGLFWFSKNGRCLVDPTKETSSGAQLHSGFTAIVKHVEPGLSKVF